MSNPNPTRVSAGTPDGGRFATGKRTEDPSVTLEPAAPEPAAQPRKSLRSVLNGMHDGEGTTVNLPDGASLEISYREFPAMGDDGRPVRGDMTGLYSLDVDGEIADSVHVSPHGTSGYGNNRAKSYAAEQVEESIAKLAARHTARKAAVR